MQQPQWSMFQSKKKVISFIVKGCACGVLWVWDSATYIWTSRSVMTGVTQSHRQRLNSAGRWSVNADLRPDASLTSTALSDPNWPQSPPVPLTDLVFCIIIFIPCICIMIVIPQMSFVSVKLAFSVYLQCCICVCVCDLLLGSVYGLLLSLW